MNEKNQKLIEKLKDERSKKVIFVSYCIMNVNTRYLGGAFRKGCVDEVIDELQRQNIGIVQMKCPEQKAWGGVLKKEILRGYGSRNTLLFKLNKLFLPLFIWNTKRIYRKIAKETVEEIKDYINSGFEVAGILGIGGSSSCGVNNTIDLKKSFEYLVNIDINTLERNQFNDFLLRKCAVQGRGFFTEALKDELNRNKIKINFYEHDLILEMNGEKVAFKL